jgi:hypothetical protein
MAIIGGHPESGVRIVLERGHEGGPPWTYKGSALTPTHRFVTHAAVNERGDVDVALDGDAPRDLALRIKTMIRSAHKHAQDDLPGAPPPRQIHRWRGSSIGR